jgi:predicted RNase H-like HicB family nuclease
MATIPQIDKPERFGSPLKDLNPTPWETFGDNVFECRVLLCPEDGGGYSAHAIRLPGVVSQGESVQTALENISEAFRGAISLYMEQGNGVPWANVEIDRPKGWLEKWILVDV